MADNPTLVSVLVDLAIDRLRWLYTPAGRQLPVVAVTRRAITVADGAVRVRLPRRQIERDGFVHADDGTAYGLRACLTIKRITP